MKSARWACAQFAGTSWLSTPIRTIDNKADHRILRLRSELGARRRYRDEELYPMNSSLTIVLPGLDGTDRLLDRFTQLAPASQPVRVIALPDDPKDNYDSLCGKLLTQIRNAQPCHLIAESFSGPVAILLAQRHPEIVERLTLVATFANSPAPIAGRFLPWTLLIRMPMPELIARRYFVGGDHEMALKLIDAIGHTSAATFAKRIHLLMNVDVCEELSRVRCPIRYIRPTCDRLVPRRCVDRILNVNDQVSVREIDGPHLIMQTRPEHVWSAIVDGDAECPESR